VPLPGDVMVTSMKSCSSPTNINISLKFCIKKSVLSSLPTLEGKIMKVGETHGEGEARAYYGGLGAEPAAWSRGRAPGGGGLGGKAP